jgi:exopolyphosphatase / guanosine-5'-triphosphate,3'-diphosphate pyrophosphatase
VVGRRPVRDAGGGRVVVTLVAAIDCGTNSIKLLVADLPQVLVRESRVVRLGQGVDETGRLSDDALARTFAAVAEFAAIIEWYDVPVARVRFCATSATRDASNQGVFVEGVRDRLGVTPQVLSGVEEAGLVFDATRLLDPLPAAPALVVDIGGGSTELVLGRPERSVSMDIGSVRLHERYLDREDVTSVHWAECRRDIEQHLDDTGLDLATAGSVVGTSGTIKTVACGVLDLSFYDRFALDGAELRVDETLEFTARLCAMSVAERRALPYMHPGRADVIGAGALIWGRILARVAVPTYLVSEADILYGIARTIV